MENLVTCDKIMEWFDQMVSSKQPIGPDIYLDAAQKLNILIGAENENLYALESLVANKERYYHEQGFTSAKARIYTKAEVVYRQMQEQKAKINQITEFIRLAKHRARRAGDEIKGY